MLDSDNNKKDFVQMYSNLYEYNAEMEEEDDDFIFDNNHKYVQLISKVPNECRH